MIGPRIRSRRKRRALDWTLVRLARGADPAALLRGLEVPPDTMRSLARAVRGFDWAPGAPLCRIPHEGDRRPLHRRAVVGVYLAVVQATTWEGRSPRALGPDIGEFVIARRLGVSRRCVVYARRALELAGVLHIWQPDVDHVPRWARSRPMPTRLRGGTVVLRAQAYTCAAVLAQPGATIRRRLARWTAPQTRDPGPDPPRVADLVALAFG